MVDCYPQTISLPIARMEHRQTLIRVLEECVDRAEQDKLSLGQVLASLSTSALALSALLLSLPFLTPVTLGPISTVGGLVLASLGWQLLQGRQKLWLPERLYAITPSKQVWEKLLGVCQFVMRMLAKLTRERAIRWVDGRLGERICGSLIMTGGVLLAIPVPVLPFNNTVPALGCLFGAVAILERDGWMVPMSVFWLCASVAYFGAFFYAVYVLGGEATVWVQQWLPFLPTW
jgi:hypothetical protein